MASRAATRLGLLTLFAGENIPRAAHVGGKLINLIETAIYSAGNEILVAQVADTEVIGPGLGVFVELQVNAAHPETFIFKAIDKVPTDESASPTNEGNLFSHTSLILEY